MVMALGYQRTGHSQPRWSSPHQGGTTSTGASPGPLIPSTLRSSTSACAIAWAAIRASGASGPSSERPEHSTTNESVLPSWLEASVHSVVGAWDPEVIDQAIPQLEELRGAAGSQAPARIVTDPPVSLSSSDMEAWTGERFAAKPEGGMDRSDTLFWIGCGVARGLRNKDLSDAAKLAIIEDAVAGRDE